MRHKIAFDAKLMRPGCALIQAAMGGDHSIVSRFHTDHWLVAPTDDMAVYEVDDMMLDILVKRVNGD